MAKREKNIISIQVRDDLKKEVKKFISDKTFYSFGKELSIPIACSFPLGIQFSVRVVNLSGRFHITFLDIKTFNNPWRTFDSIKKNTVFSMEIGDIYTQEEFENFIIENKSTISNILLDLTDIDDWEIRFE